MLEVFTNIDKDLESIQSKFNSVKKQVEILSKENARLKNEHYKDEELQQLQAKIKDLEHSLHIDSFYVLTSDKKKAEEWAKKHSLICKNPYYSYRFYPIPGIGCCGQIWCEYCNDSFEFCSD